MIRKYRVKNFGPFKLTEELNFLAQKKSENKKHILLNSEILPVIAFYGPNGGGKTSFISSFAFLQNLVLQSKSIWEYLPGYLNIDSDSKEMEFYIEFEEDENIFLYELIVNENHIIQEKFDIQKKSSIKKTNIFNYKSNKYNNKYIPKSLNISNKNKRTTLLNFLNFIIDCNEIKRMFNFIKNIIYFSQDDFSSKDLFAFQNFLSRTDWNIIENEKYKVLQILKDIDINIVDIMVYRDPIMKNRINSVFFTKKTSYNKMETINAQLESSGTLKFISLISYLLSVIQNGTLFIVDELDSGLHTKLLKYIILIFKNKKINKNNSQLIFSSHDLGTLNSDIFRRDEIYFAAMNESYFSNLISLSDLIIDKGNKKVRNDHNYAKLYKEGKLGYDPYIDYSLKGFLNDK